MTNWQQYVDVEQVRKTLAILKPEGRFFEIRIIGTDTKGTITGYFNNADTFFESLNNINLKNKNVYITINALKDGVEARLQLNQLIQTKLTTSDTDIKAYEWLFIDLDPKRSSGVSSSEAELTAAKELARKIYNYLNGLGFEDPVKALSGNGCHLLYKIALENNEDNRKLVSDCLKTLSMIFDNDQVSVDTTNFNPARICKLHGTLAQKGTSTEDRPHRMSRIFSDIVDVKVTKKMFLEKLVAQLPKEDEPVKPAYTHTYQSNDFDFEGFMRQHLDYDESKVTSNDRATIYPLSHCPFDASHADGDAKVFHYNNGAIAFKCHHNSCVGKKWHDVRKMFDPAAYDRTDDDEKYEQGWKAHNRDKESKQVPYTEITDRGDMFRTAKMIRDDVEPDHEYIRSGIEVIDTKMHGLEKTCVSVISGLRASAKSTLIGNIILSAVNDGHTVVCYSGELNNKKYLDWLVRQAAGKTNVETSTKFAGGYGVSNEVYQKVTDWMGDHFWLYNNKYGNKFDKIAEYLRAKLKETRADLCIIDNLMALDLESFDNKNEYTAQTKFVWELKNIAELANVHVIFVAHPRKSNGLLRLTDISGSGNIANIVDNAFIIHRWNRDFEKGYQEFFNHEPETDIDRCTNIIEITKDREGGLQDEFIPLYYEESTKRLRNHPDEYIRYGWDTEDFEPVTDSEVIPF